MSKLSKKLMSLFLVFLLFFVTTATTADAQEQFPSADKTVSDIIAGWNLGNTLESYGDWIKDYTSGNPDNYETAWGNPVTTQDMIKAVKDAGFNAVRIPVTYQGHFDNKGNIDKKWLDRVEEVVNYVINEGMYCIINLHHDTGSSGWLKASSTDYSSTSVLFQNLWKQIADRFSNYDNKLLFEGFNEILDSAFSYYKTNEEGYKVVNDLNQLFVDTVRSTGGNNKYRNLILNPYNAMWYNDSLASMKIPTDTEKNHLIVEVHCYFPLEFTCTDIVGAVPTDQWGSDMDKNNIDTISSTLKYYSDNYGVPIIIGEWMCLDKKNESERKEYSEYFVKAFGMQGIKCFWWDNGTTSKLIDRKTSSISNPDLVTTIVTAAKECKTALKEEQVISGVKGSYVKTYGDSSFTLKAKSSGDGQITYSSSDTDVISINSDTGKVKINGVGTADITVTAAATDQYQQAVKKIKIKVKKGKQ